MVNITKSFLVYASDDHFLLMNAPLITQAHQHQFLHVIICMEPVLSKQLHMQVGNSEVFYRGLILKGNTAHVFHGQHQQHALILVDHTSQLGRSLDRHYLTKHNAYTVLPDPLTLALARILSLMPLQVVDVHTYHILWSQILDVLNLTSCGSAHSVADARIVRALSKLNAEGNFHRTLAQVAQHVHLSPSRFSHLFKTYTGSTLKSYLLFKQLLNALTLIAQGNTVTKAALDSGFDTPSHLSATCKKLMGIQPHAICQVSRFLKVSQYH